MSTGIPRTARNTVAAAFVTYNCGREVLANVADIHPQVDRIFVVDNGSSEESQRYLEQLERSNRVTVIRLGSNFGIAKGLNVGLRAIVDAGYAWALTMDQDSRPDGTMVENLLSGLEAHGEVTRVAMIAPLIRGANDGSLIQGWDASSTDGTAQPPRETMICMTSGALTSTTCWEKVGGFKEEFFIDCVDNEYCLRCISQGFTVLQDFHATLQHNLGRRRYHRLTSRINFSATHHSPMRRYFITRNRIVTWKIYRSLYPHYVRDDIKNALVESVKILLVEDDKWRKCVAIIRGIKDGFFWSEPRITIR